MNALTGSAVPLAGQAIRPTRGETATGNVSLAKIPSRSEMTNVVAIAAPGNKAKCRTLPEMPLDHAHHVAEFSYALAFMTGLLGSGHCLGMCGGLVSGFFMKLNARGTSGPTSPITARGSAIYALVGLIAAALGAVLVATGVIGLAQGVLQIVAGAVVILLGLDMLGVSPIRNTVGFAPHGLAAPAVRRRDAEGPGASAP